jgi:hypothetical protein
MKKVFKTLFIFCSLVFLLNLCGNKFIRCIQELFENLFVVDLGEYVRWYSILFCRKMFHVVGFFILYRILNKRVSARISLVLVVFLASIDEFLQIFIPGRTASVIDFFLDVSLPLIWYAKSKKNK